MPRNKKRNYPLKKGATDVSSRRGPDNRTPLTDAEKMKIIQLRDIGLPQNEIAHEIGCSRQTVIYTLKNCAPANVESVKKARADVLAEYAGKLMAKATEALDHITPESMTHDRIEVFDEKGELIEVKHSGPTGFQNSNIAGQLINQALKMQDKELELRGERVESGPSGIEDVSKLLESIGKRATSLNIDIKMDELREEVKAVEAEFEDVSEQDGVDED